MITHEINKYNIVTTYKPSWTSEKSDFNAMGKLEYALYLQRLSYRCGDLVVSNNARSPYQAYEVYRVKDIDEVHHFVKWGNAYTGPLVLNLETVYGHTLPVKHGANLYKKVDVGEIPGQWQDKLNADA